jgi:CheY-like chemotaxis protein
LNPLILVVDDEPDVETLFRQQFRRDLHADRFKMEFAQSGDIALQRIRDAVDVSLILILSDINMPGMTGLELLPKAKALRPDVPVIMITAYGDADTKRKALENGAETLSPSRSISGRFAARSTCGLSAPLKRPLVSFNVRYWHKADIARCTAHVRFRGQSGHDLLRCTCLLLTQSGDGTARPLSLGGQPRQASRVPDLRNLAHGLPLT